jgi:cytochrome c oxidase subunit 2
MMVELDHARSFTTLLILLGAAACYRSPATGVALGEKLFETCAPCHGVNGVGNPELAAPAIAGLPQWYVEAQLESFQAGFRGKHADDLPGLRMRPIAVSLNRDGDIPSVAEYVSSLDPPFAASTLHGNAGAGAQIYTPCVACHGTDGLGNELLRAPPLVQMDDWYLVQELQNFKQGARGTVAGDTWGITMRVNTLALSDQAMEDVVAYVQTLR